MGNIAAVVSWTKIKEGDKNPRFFCNHIRKI